jgi:tricorn protease-like protein
MHAHRSFRAPVLASLRAVSFAALIAAPFATPAAPALPLAASTATTVAATPASTKRAPTHEDVWLLKRVGAPSVSPDGRWAAFSVVEPAYDRKDQKSDLWLVAVDGSAPPRRLTNTAAGESGVTWSPDGKKLAFSSKREGDSDEQVYVLDLAGGGEALRVTNAPLGARTP